MSQDERRVEAAVHGGGRPRNMSAVYLAQALDALYATGDAPSLYESRAPQPTDMRSAVQHVLATMQARQRRRMFSRLVVLFSAFAAESYVNEFLAARMSDRRKRLREMDRHSTPWKFLEGTYEAYGERLFSEDSEAMPVLRRLFKLRNKLAHPKPGFGPATMFDADDEAERDFAPPKVAEFVVMVAGAGDLLIWRAYGKDTIDAIATVLWRGRSVIQGYGERAATMPTPDRPSEPPLYEQAVRSVQQQGQTPAIDEG